MQRNHALISSPAVFLSSRSAPTGLVDSLGFFYRMWRFQPSTPHTHGWGVRAAIPYLSQPLVFSLPCPCSWMSCYSSQDAWRHTILAFVPPFCSRSRGDRFSRAMNLHYRTSGQLLEMGAGETSVTSIDSLLSTVPAMLQHSTHTGGLPRIATLPPFCPHFQRVVLQ